MILFGLTEAVGAVEVVKCSIVVFAFTGCVTFTAAFELTFRDWNFDWLSFDGCYDCCYV